MKYQLGIVTALIAAMTLGIAPALAKKGPGEKANGGVSVSESGLHISFNAHESRKGSPAKGQAGVESVETNRRIHVKVKYVVIEGDNAWFAGRCTSDSEGTAEGAWLFVKAIDNGTPGRKGDRIGWDWSSADENDARRRVETLDAPDHMWDVIGGNLVVHGEDGLVPT